MTRFRVTLKDPDGVSESIREQAEAAAKRSYFQGTMTTAWPYGLDANGVPCSMLSFPDPTEVVVGAMRSAVSTVVTMLMAETSVTNGDES